MKKTPCIWGEVTFFGFQHVHVSPLQTAVLCAALPAAAGSCWTVSASTAVQSRSSNNGVCKSGGPPLQFAVQEFFRCLEVLQVTLNGEFCSTENLARTN